MWFIVTVMYFKSPCYDATDMDLASEKLFAEKLASVLLTHFPNIGMLKYNQQFDGTYGWSTENSIFHKFSTQLHVFLWSSSNFVSLPDLHPCRDIRIVYIFGDAAVDFVEMLDSIENMLEELRISIKIHEHSCLETLDAIQEHCLHLRKIGLHFGSLYQYRAIPRIEEWHNRHTSFLCSYGAQLIEASYAPLDPEMFCEVNEKCPNLKFEYPWIDFRNNDELKRISVMGTKFELA